MHEAPQLVAPLPACSSLPGIASLVYVSSSGPVGKCYEDEVVYRWQATWWPLVAERKTGSISEQTGLANGQRGWKRQPAGGFNGLGTSRCNNHFLSLLIWV